MFKSSLEQQLNFIQLKLEDHTKTYLVDLQNFGSFLCQNSRPQKQTAENSLKANEIKMILQAKRLLFEKFQFKRNTISFHPQKLAIIFLLMLDLAVAQGTIQNQLYNAENRINVSWGATCSPNSCGCTTNCEWLSSLCSCRYWTGSSIYVTNSSANLNDIVTGDNTDSTGAICTAFNSPVAANSISYGINLLSGAVSARTFMSVWSSPSVSATNFQTATQTVSFKKGSSYLTTQFKATGMNSVWTTGSELMTFDYMQAQVKYNSVAVGEAVKLCYDSIFALRQYYLNPYLSNTYIGYKESATDKWISGPQNLHFDQQFTQGSKCPSAFVPSTPTNQIVSNGMFNQDYSNNPAGSVIITSIFTQFASDHPTSKTQVNHWEFDTSNMKWNFKWFTTQTGNMLNQFENLSSVLIAVRVQNVHYGTSMRQHICTIQTFGWPFCEVSAIALTSAITMLVNSGNSIQFQAQSTAYYDPKELKQDNHFCSLTLQVILYVNEVSQKISFPVNTQTQKVDSQVITMTLNGVLQEVTATLDPSTLVVDLSYTGSINSTTSGSHIIFMQALDNRDTSATAVQTTQNLTVNFACDQIGLATGSFQFSNSSFVNNQTFTYVVGVGNLGVQNFNPTTPKCTGYTGFQVYASFIQQSIQVNQTVNSNKNTFTACQNSTTEDICFLWEDSTSSLKYFSNHGSNETFLVQIYLVFSGEDKSGVKKTYQTQPLSFVIQKIDFTCRKTSFTYQVFEQEQIHPQGLDLFVMNSQQQYQIFLINSCNSSNLSCDGTPNCGPLHFNLSADNKDTNYQHAIALLNNQNQMQVVVSPDSYSVNLIFPLLDPTFAGMKLVYQLRVGLQMFSNSLPALDPVVNYQITVTIVQFYPQSSNLTVPYSLGLVNSKIKLPSYIIKPSSYQIKNLTVRQIAGQNIPISQYQADAASLTFQVQTDNPNLSNSSATFQFTATLNSPKSSSNSDLFVAINFVSASTSQILEQNTPPYFIQPLKLPDVIKCQDQEEQSSWKYVFPKSQDDQNNQISIRIDCQNIDNGLILLSQEDQNTYSLTFQRATNVKTMPKSFTCETQLSDSNKAVKKYNLTFTSDCEEDFSNSLSPQQRSTKKLKAKPSHIEINSKQGKFVIMWETPMMIPQKSSSSSKNENKTSSLTNQRSLQSQLCWDLCPVTVSVLPGAKSSKSDNTDISISIIEYKTEETVFGINFTNPLAVSAGKQLDLLQITFQTVECFKNISGQIVVKQGQNMTIKLPKQDSPGVTEVPTATIQSLVTTVVSTTSILMLITNFLKNGVLNQLLSVISSLTIITHMFLVALNYPQQLLDFFGLIFPLITFDAVPEELLNPLYEMMFKFSEQNDYAVNDQFDSVGYGSIFVVANIGSMFLLICFTIAQWVSIGLLNCLLNKTFCTKKSSKVKKSKCKTWIGSTAKDHQWSGVFSFFSDGYLVLAVVAFIGSNDLRLGNDYNFTENFNSAFAAFLMIFVLVFPGLIACFYFYKLRHLADKKADPKIVEECTKQNIEYSSEIQLTLKLEDEHFTEFREKYGVFLEGVRINRLHYVSATLTKFLDLVFQLLVAVSLTRLVTYPVFVIFQFNFNILFNVGFVIYFMPYQEAQENYLTIINYLTYLVLNYHLFLFTAFVDESMYFLIANSVIYLVWASVTVNAFFALNNVVSEYLTKLKLIYARWAYRGRKPILQILKEKMAKILKNKKTKTNRKLKPILKKPSGQDCNEFLSKQKKQVTFSIKIEEDTKKRQATKQKSEPLKHGDPNNEQINNQFSNKKKVTKLVLKKHYKEDQDRQASRSSQLEIFHDISIDNIDSSARKLMKEKNSKQKVMKSEIQQLQANSKQKIPLPKLQTTDNSDIPYRLKENQITAKKSNRSDPLEQQYQRQDQPTYKKKGMKNETLLLEEAKQNAMELNERRQQRKWIIAGDNEIVVCPWDATQEGYVTKNGYFVVIGPIMFSTARK